MHVTADREPSLVIPPGQEGVILRMLEVSGIIEGGWRFERASIEQGSIEAYYRGQNEQRARIILRPRDDAPAGWRRTEQFALGLAAEPPDKAAVTLYRTVLAQVRRGEARFAWRPTGTSRRSADRPTADRTSEAADEIARRARAAESELDLHLDHTPFVELDVEFDHAAAFAEAIALADRFVTYQSDPTYDVAGWRGLALQALDGDPSRVATTDDDAGVYQDQSRYRRTEIAALCPITMALLERLIDFDQCRTVSFLMLEPGARITVHVDGEGPPVIRSVNIALNMPEGCRLVIDCNADGSDNSYTRTVPFRPGSAFMLNVAKYHYVINDSEVPRIHVIARGSLRQSVLEVLALAEEQDGMRGAAAVEAALTIKRQSGGAMPDGGAAQVEVSAAADPPLLSPFVSTYADAASAQLLKLLDLGDHAITTRLGPNADAAVDWQMEVDLRLPSGVVTHLDFQAAKPERPAWFRTASLICSYRVDGADPFEDPRDAAFFKELRTRLANLDPPGLDGPAPRLATLFEALDRYRPFLEVQDKEFRILFRGSAAPVGILWLGFRCNQDCRMCWQDRNWPAPPDEMFDRWIDEFCAAGVSSLILSGGEPTLHPRLPDWLRRAKRAQIPATVETNAIRFTEPNFLSTLRESGLTSVVVSLHDADPSVSDAMTGAPGSFALTVAGTRAALASGLDVGVHCVVERQNVSRLEAHARFVVDELNDGGNRVGHVSYSFPIGYRRRDLYRGAIAPIDELRPHLSAAVRILREQNIYVSFLGTSGFTPCALEDPASLAPFLPERVTDEMRESRTFVEGCSVCALRTRCLGVHHTYVEQHGARGVEPVR